MSTAVVDVVRAARAARPAWVVAKGGITSHDVAVHGLGIRRAEVLGQLLPGLVSVFRPIEAPDEVLGVPYVVFAGNVGDETTLAYVADLFAGGALMLAHGPEMLRDARAEGRAVPAFTTYTLESTRAICAAAERRGPAGDRLGRVQLVPGQLAGDARRRGAWPRRARPSVPVGVHLDHSSDLAEIRACLRLGYTSVMFDGSRLPFEENVALTRTVVAEAHAAGVWVEAELGGVAGDEDVSTGAQAGELTDPDAAAEFVSRTGVDALAAAVGTVHGLTTAPMQVDLDRIRAISALTDVPFVLHGASGLSDGELTAAVAAGVAKVNVNAELRRAYFAALDGDGGDDIPQLQARLVDAMARVAARRRVHANVRPRSMAVVRWRSSGAFVAPGL